MIKVFILGQGMVATTFAVGLERIKNGEIEPYGIPLAHLDLGIGIDEVEVVASADVDARKVGKSVYEVARDFYGFDNVPRTLRKIKVYPGIELGYVKDIFPINSLDMQNSLQESMNKFFRLMKRIKPDVVVDLTTTQYAEPLGSYDKLESSLEKGELAPSQVYAYLALRYMKEVNSMAYVNVTPAPVANDPAFVSLAEDWRGLILGDDGATGATPLTADLLEHLKQRSRRVLSIAQFNIGGNTDFLALTDFNRNRAKEFTKSSIVKDILGYEVPHYIKPTGFLEPLGDKKFVAMHIEYVSFNGAKDELVINMRINDSPALAGYLVDLARIAKLALENEVYGTIYDVNAFYMKKPGPLGSKNLSRILAYQKLISFISEMRKLSVKQRASLKMSDIE